MSQQINLLPAAPKMPLASARNAALALAAWCVLLAVQGWLGSHTVDTTRVAADRGTVELRERRQLLQALQKKLGEGEQPNDIAAQITALEPRTRVSRDLLERLKSGELGSLDGYGAQLAEFARIPQQGVWVTTVTVSQAGRALRVEGRALRKEQILPYAAALNRAMRKYGIVLKDVEVAPLKQTAGDEAGIPADTAADTAAATGTVPVWTFKLY